MRCRGSWFPAPELSAPEVVVEEEQQKQQQPPPHHAAFALIDWSRPWLAPLATAGARAAARVLGGASVAAALNQERQEQESCAQHPEAGFAFVSQAQLPEGTPYERFIYETRSIPTRDNLHDFFNGLIWLHYPQTKRLLNQWQARAIEQQSPGDPRGPLRDAITVFDENGALLIAPAPLREALKNREWRSLGERLRPLWQQSRLVPVGHALLEKLVQPRKSITAHVFLAGDGAPLSADVDDWMALHFDAQAFAAKPFNPLPVLGVPGWWSENENVCFYDDRLVFRSDSRKIAQQKFTASAG